MVAAEALDTTLRIESFRLTPVFGRVVVLLQRALSWARSRVACAGFACALSRSLDRLSSFILPSFLGSLSSFLFLPFRSFLSCVPFLPLFRLLPFLSFCSFLSFLPSCSASLSFCPFLSLNPFLSSLLLLLSVCPSSPSLSSPRTPFLPLACRFVQRRKGRTRRRNEREGRKEERTKGSNASKTAVAICSDNYCLGVP